MFCKLTKCCKIILGPKIVVRLSYDRLWIGPLVTGVTVSRKIRKVLGCPMWMLRIRINGGWESKENWQPRFSQRMTNKMVWHMIGVARGGPKGLGPREWKNFHNRFNCVTETNIYMKSLCSVANVTKYVSQKSWKMSKISNLLPSDVFFQAPNAPNPVFRWGSAPDPAGSSWHYPESRPPSQLSRKSPSPYLSPSRPQSRCRCLPRFLSPSNNTSRLCLWCVMISRKIR